MFKNSLYFPNNCNNAFGRGEGNLKNRKKDEKNVN